MAESTQITHRALDLGCYVGLAQFLPGILLFSEFLDMLWRIASTARKLLCGVLRGVWHLRVATFCWYRRCCIATLSVLSTAC